jgi:undecaprenyl-diphosphatase
VSGHLTYVEAVVIGLLQGVTELFPVSSLGHSVLIPALIGGRWAADLNVSAKESPYLAFIVGLHVATAIALIVYFWRDWLRILRGLWTSIRLRRVVTADERLAWMIILGTIPVGITGLALEHTFRTVLGRPIPAAIFLTVNGIILYAAERWRRRASTNADAQVRAEAGQAHADLASDARISGQPMRRMVAVATAQIAALLPGISRSGVTMAAGLRAGLSHEDSARFAFLLATPVILAAGVLKIPSDLFGSLGAGIKGQVLAGSLASGLAAYFSGRFLSRYFITRTLTPFAVYCFVAGLASLAWLTLA